MRWPRLKRSGATTLSPATAFPPVIPPCPPLWNNFPRNSHVKLIKRLYGAVTSPLGLANHPCSDVQKDNNKEASWCNSEGFPSKTAAKPPELHSSKGFQARQLQNHQSCAMNLRTNSSKGFQAREPQNHQSCAMNLGTNSSKGFPSKTAAKPPELHHEP